MSESARLPKGEAERLVYCYGCANESACRVWGKVHLSYCTDPECGYTVRWVYAPVTGIEVIRESKRVREMGNG